MSYSGQDWETVVFRKQKPQQKTTHVAYDALNAKKVDAATDSERPKYVSRELATAITQARCLKKLTQAALDAQLALTQHTIQNIESCKAIYNPTQISKIARYLGISTTNIPKYN